MLYRLEIHHAFAKVSIHPDFCNEILECLYVRIAHHEQSEVEIRPWVVKPEALDYGLSVSDLGASADLMAYVP